MRSFRFSGWAFGLRGFMNFYFAQPLLNYALFSLLNYAAGNLWKTDDAMPQQVRECKMAVTSLQAIHGIIALICFKRIYKKATCNTQNSSNIKQTCACCERIVSLSIWSYLALIFLNFLSFKFLSVLAKERRMWYVSDVWCVMQAAQEEEHEAWTQRLSKAEAGHTVHNMFKMQVRCVRCVRCVQCAVFIVSTFFHLKRKVSFCQWPLIHLHPQIYKRERTCGTK